MPGIAAPGQGTRAKGGPIQGKLPHSISASSGLPNPLGLLGYPVRHLSRLPARCKHHAVLTMRHYVACREGCRTAGTSHPLSKAPQLILLWSSMDTVLGGLGLGAVGTGGGADVTSHGSWYRTWPWLNGACTAMLHWPACHGTHANIQKAPTHNLLNLCGDRWAKLTHKLLSNSHSSSESAVILPQWSGESPAHDFPPREAHRIVGCVRGRVGLLFLCLAPAPLLLSPLGNATRLSGLNELSAFWARLFRPIRLGSWNPPSIMIVTAPPSPGVLQVRRWVVVLR